MPFKFNPLTGNLDYYETSSGGTGVPASSVTDETTYGLSPAVGISTNYARQDHTHGSQNNPVAGTDTQVQFNDGGVFGGDAKFAWDKTNSALQIGDNPTLLPNNPLAMQGNVDSYLQSNLQNTNNGVDASADYIITADDGDDTQFYADFGIGNSGYTSVYWDVVGPHDTYIFGDGGNVAIGSLSVGKKIPFFIAQTEHEAHPADVVAECDSDGINLPSGKTYRINGEMLPDSHVAVQKLGTPAVVTTVRDFVDNGWSSGVISGGALTDNGDGTVNIASGESMLRPTADDDDDLISVTFPAVTNVSLTDDATNFVFVNYNSGTPAVQTSTSSNDFNCLDKCHLYTIVRDGNTLYVLEGRFQNKDANRKHRRRLYKTDPFAHTQGGTVLDNSSRYLTVTSGEFFYSLNPLSHSAYDTSVAGTANANVFDYYYSDGAGGWTKVADSKQIDNTNYDDGDGTLGALTILHYGVHWVYLILHTTPRLAVVYGTSDYATLADAQAAGMPSSLPPAVLGAGILIGRAIIQKSNTTVDAIESAFDTSFSASGIPNHNDTGSKQGGTTNEYYHLTSAEVTKLSGIATGAEVNVNADWNAVSGDAQILNKPPVPTQYTDEMAQDAVGSMSTNSIVYSDATPSLQLSGDEASPGNSQYYGTDSGGTKGFHTLPSGGGFTKDTIGVTVDGGGSAITTGAKGYKVIQENCTITGWTLLGKESGSCVIDIKKCTYAGFPTTASIAGTEKPTLTSVQKNQDLTLATWTTSLTAGDILEFVVDSASTVTRVNLFINIEK